MAGVTIVRTGDGASVPWPYGAGAALIYTPLRKEVIEGLTHPDFATRCVNIAALSYGQLLLLFRESHNRHARLWKLYGSRIVSTQTLKYASGLGRKKILRIYSDRKLLANREALIAELAKHW